MKEEKLLYAVDYGFCAGASVHTELFLTEKEAGEFYEKMEGCSYRKMYKTRDIWGFREKSEKTGKSAFVDNELSKLLHKVDEDIESADYDITIGNEEYVYVRYKNGSVLKICVTADSLSALCRDVLSRI